MPSDRHRRIEAAHLISLGLKKLIQNIILSVFISVSMSSKGSLYWSYATNIRYSNSIGASLNSGIKQPYSTTCKGVPKYSIL